MSAAKTQPRKRTTVTEPVNASAAASVAAAVAQLAATTASTAASLASTAATTAIETERRMSGIEGQLHTAAELSRVTVAHDADLAASRHETLLTQLKAIDEKQAIANGRTGKNETAITDINIWRTKATTVFLVINGLALFAGPFVFAAVNKLLQK